MRQDRHASDASAPQGASATGRDSEQSRGITGKMWLTRRDCGRLAGLALTLGVARAAGTMPAGSASGLLALRGFDPVSYFLPGGPAPGSADHESSWRGRVWRFANARNRATFGRDPEVYAPRLGGFDPAGILEERLVDADPLVFALVEARLYLFRDAARRARCLAEPTLLRQAEALWPRLGRLLDAAPE